MASAINLKKPSGAQKLPDKFRRSLRRHQRSLTWVVEDVNWKHVAFKIIAFSYLAFMIWITWVVVKISPYYPDLQASSRVPIQSDQVPIITQNVKNYFNAFDGAATCNIHGENLYIPPTPNEKGELPANAYCSNRATLLEAMSGGGRIGFDAPYMPRGCQYRWYSVEEICSILERFDAIVFIGDETIETIYAGFNTLLRSDLIYGALRKFDLPADELHSCECNSQFTNPSCKKHFLKSSDEVSTHVGGKHMDSYACQRVPHAFLPTDKSPASKAIVSKFKTLVPVAPPSNYKPIPVIHSLTGPKSIELASDSLTEFSKLAYDTKRKTPMLWLGPTAAGHIEMKGRKGNQEIWRFAWEMQKIAIDKDIESLGLWNLTVQAESWDGKNFGEEVGIVGAMMVINWLSRLPSS